MSETGPLLSLKEAAALLKMAPKTLYNWRSEGTGPASLRLRGRVVYRKRDVEAWVRRETGTEVRF